MCRKGVPIALTFLLVTIAKQFRDPQGTFIFRSPGRSFYGCKNSATLLALVLRRQSLEVPVGYDAGRRSSRGACVRMHLVSTGASRSLSLFHLLNVPATGGEIPDTIPSS